MRAAPMDRFRLGGPGTGSGSVSSPSRTSSELWSKCGSHSSHEGRYQFRSPSSFIDAGRRTPRTIVASIRIAAASPTPNCLKNSIDSVANTANTQTITSAALVTTPAVDLIPVEIASSIEAPRWKRSRIRLTMNTW